jgi:hypothetical protein
VESTTLVCHRIISFPYFYRAGFNCNHAWHCDRSIRGAAVPSVTVNGTNVDTNQTTHYTTNGADQYVVPDLPVSH